MQTTDMPTPAAKRRLILFLHGLGGSDENSWGAFKELLEADPALQGFDVAFLSQPSSVWRSWISPVAATIETLADALATELIEQWSAFDEVLLVTHSMGGLVARKWLVDMLVRGSTSNVRGIVFFAVPHEGSSLARFGVRFSADHKQLAQLKPKSPLIRHLNETWVRLDCAKRLSLWNVTAARDACVSPESSGPLWLGGQTRTVADRDHRSVIKPASVNETSYKVVRNAALELAGGSGGDVVEARSDAIGRAPLRPSSSRTELDGRADVPAGGGNPLFYCYSAADEEYYLVRPGDGRLAQILPFRHVWLHGPPGCGKTACVMRGLTRANGRHGQLTLGAAAGGDLDQLLTTLEGQLARVAPPTQLPAGDVIDRIVEMLNAAAATGLTALLIEEIPLGDVAHDAFFGAVRAIVLRHATQAPGIPVRLVFTSMVDPGRAFDGNDLAAESVAVLLMPEWSEVELRRLLQIVVPPLNLDLQLDETVIVRVLSSHGVSPRFIKMFLGNILMLGASPGAVDDALAATSGSLAS